jgi:hypothetical protein
VRGSAGRVVSESVECSDDGWEIGDAHWDSYRRAEKGRTSECSKSEGRRCLEYFWMAVAQVQPQKYFK